MKQKLLVVAALLLAIQANQAAAAEKPDYLLKDTAGEIQPPHNSKKVEKILMMLKTIGISDPSIAEFATSVDARTEGGYFTLHEERIMGGSLKLRYETKPSIGVKQLELRYTPQDSHMEYVARKDSVMANYKLKF